MKPNNGQRITTLLELYGAETVVAGIFMSINIVFLVSGMTPKAILDFFDLVLNEAELVLDTEGAKIKAMVEDSDVR